MTEAENTLFAMTAALWNAFLNLPSQHAADLEETARDIHNIQNRILARATLRGLNEAPRE